jgi:hypothetical protein
LAGVSGPSTLASKARVTAFPLQRGECDQVIEFAGFRGKRFHRRFVPAIRERSPNTGKVEPRCGCPLATRAAVPMAGRAGAPVVHDHPDNGLGAVGPAAFLRT